MIFRGTLEICVDMDDSDVLDHWKTLGPSREAVNLETAAMSLFTEQFYRLAKKEGDGVRQMEHILTLGELKIALVKDEDRELPF